MAERIDYKPPSKVSRYKRTPVWTDATNMYFETPGYESVPITIDDEYFMVTKKYENRLDLLAHKYYQDSKLWWVIALANAIENPLELEVGTVVRIPATATLFGTNGVVSAEASPLKK